MRTNAAEGNHNFLHWNRDTPTCVYGITQRSLDSGVTWANYPASMGGVLRVFPGNHDIIYGVIRNSSNSNTLKRSTDKGATSATLAEIGWDIYDGLLRNVILAIHPTDPGIFFCLGPTGDLARYDASTGVWKTDYNLIALHNAANPASRPGTTARCPRSRSTRRTPMSAMSASSASGRTRSGAAENIQSASPTWEDVTYNLHRCNIGLQVRGAPAHRRRLLRQRRHRRTAAAESARRQEKPLAGAASSIPL